MSNFPTYYTRDDTVYFNCSGDPIKKVYQLEYDPVEFNYKPVHVKNHNLQDEIDSYRDGCDLNIILKNLDVYEVNNLYSSYSFSDVANTFINDFVGVPTTYGDALKLQASAENMFNGLPDEIRKEYNYSSYAFARDIGSEHFINFFSQNVNNSSQNVNNSNEGGDYNE